MLYSDICCELWTVNIQYADNYADKTLILLHQFVLGNIDDTNTSYKY